MATARKKCASVESGYSATHRRESPSPEPNQRDFSSSGATIPRLMSDRASFQSTSQAVESMAKARW